MHAYERRTDVFLKTFENFCAVLEKSVAVRQARYPVAMSSDTTDATGACATTLHAVVQHSTRNSCEIKTEARARKTLKWYPEAQFKAIPLRNPSKCIPCLFDDNSYPIHTTLLRPHAGGSRHFHNLLHTRSVIIDLLSRIFRFLTYLV